jgi:hypothetical protein
MKFQWLADKRKFRKRKYRAFVLVLDGTWNGEDIEVLQHAGWDYIFYADEMDQMIKLIKNFNKKKKVNIPKPKLERTLAVENEQKTSII